jgi:hypothetical protein
MRPLGQNNNTPPGVLVERIDPRASCTLESALA